MNRQHGFSLIEIMIVIAIISILIAIAAPNYSNYVNQARRNEGITSLLEMMQQQERYFTEQLTYVTDLTLLGYTVDGSGKMATENSHYLISAELCAGMATADNCVTLTAEPQGIQAADGDITLDSRGMRTPPEFWQ